MAFEDFFGAIAMESVSFYEIGQWALLKQLARLGLADYCRVRLRAITSSVTDEG